MHICVYMLFIYEHSRICIHIFLLIIIIIKNYNKPPFSLSAILHYIIIKITTHIKKRIFIIFFEIYQKKETY
jgi:hypothetical protein